ncbi:MAG: tetratricopeptide repeat protein [Desulfomonilaceae bacterium]
MRYHAALSATLILFLVCVCPCASEEPLDFDKGVALRIEGKSAQAVTAFKKVLAVSPTHVRALVQMGAALEDQRKWKEAAQAYRRALEVNPLDGSAVRNLAQLASSRSMVTPIPAQNPSKEDLIRNGLQALEAKDFHKAAEICRLCRGLFPSDPRPLFYAAITLERQGRSRAAIALYERSVEVFPDYLPSRINLIIALISAGDRENAGKLAQKTLELVPDNPRVLYLDRLLGRPGLPVKKGVPSGRGAAGP